MNLDSSWSHVIFRLSIQNEELKVNSQINVVDLAGSENGSLNTEQARKIEAGFINKSLTSLKWILNQIASNNHKFVRKVSSISKRDSKLTRLLSDTLNYNNCICMFVCVSPHKQNLAQTKESLEFATCMYPN